MISRGLAAIPIALAIAGGTARADDHSLHVTGAIQAAWTDNLFSAETAPESDFYYQLRPGVLGTYETPRMITEADYQLEADLYQTHREAWSLQHIAALHAFFLTSPRTELNTSAQLSTGQATALSTLSAAGNGQPPSTANSEGPTDYTSLDLSEALSYSATQKVRVAQGARARWFGTSQEDMPASSSDGFEAGLTLGADRGWRYSAAAFTVGASYVALSRSATATTASQDNHQLYTTAVATWRRDLGRTWTAMLDAGATTIVPLDAGSSTVVQPTIGGQLTYTPAWGSAAVQLRRSVTPDLYIAQNTITDSAVVNGRLPLPWLRANALEPGLIAEATLGARRSQIIDTTTGSADSSFDALSVDVGLAWQPRKGVAVGLRYQYVQQIADMTLTAVSDFSRNTIMITASGRFPDALAAEVPVRDSLRVDRSDVTPVGEEVKPSQAP